MEARREYESVSELFGDLSRQINTLIRQEVEFAKLEIAKQASKAGKGAVMLTAGGALAYVGIFTVVAAAVFALALVVPLWLSALLIGIAVLITGLLLVQIGRSRLRVKSLKPEKTIAIFKEDISWMKNKM